jgi:uncharacterized membrane protein YjjP (DUF1212 family)
MAPKHLNRRHLLLFAAAAVLLLLPSGCSATAIEYCSKRASRSVSVSRVVFAGLCFRAFLF